MRTDGVRLAKRAGVVAALGLIIVTGLALSACGAPGAPPAPAAGQPVAAANATQMSEGGQVTIAVTRKATDGTSEAFDVVMDTHAVDLDGYDLRQLATLRTDRGVTVLPAGWDAPKGGHHRKGTLVFPATAPDGRSVVGPDTRSIELIIRDVAGVPERSFRWTL